jgi:hypothetical protein
MSKLGKKRPIVRVDIHRTTTKVTISVVQAVIELSETDSLPSHNDRHENRQHQAVSQCNCRAYLRAYPKQIVSFHHRTSYG